MEIITTTFGGVLVKTDYGNIAVNAGADLPELEAAYILDDVLPVAIVMTAEHLHRSRNAARFAKKHDVLLVGGIMAFGYLNIWGIRRNDIYYQREVTIGRLVMNSLHIHYDTINPFALTISDGNEVAGIVMDGKLSADWPETVNKLHDCDQIYFSNCRNKMPEFPKALANRCRAVYNTTDEIKALFADYSGKMIFPPEKD